VQFEISPKNINKTVEVHYAIEGDLVHGLEQLLPMVQSQRRDGWLSQIAEWKARYPFTFDPSSDILKPQAVIAELDRQLKTQKDQTIITTGIGQHQMWAAQFYRWRHPRTFISSGGLGTMGFGLPAAIGAKVAQPTKMVIDIDGDASFSMTAMELATAAQYDIHVKVLLMNNNFQGMVKQWQDLFYDARYSGTPMVNPDFVKLAEATGIRGIRLDHPRDLEQRITEFLQEEGSVLLDARVDRKEHVYPMVPGGAGLDEMVLGVVGK